MKYQSVQYFNKMGERHRLDGPAYIDIDGHKEWYQNGERHRLDGPAVIYADGSKSWWLSHNRHGRTGDEPPEEYLEELERLGVKFVRGSD